MKLPSPKLILCQAFPIFQWSRSYDLDIAVGDLIAGVTIALTLIPQSIAYASLAGFEPQYGLYASFIGGFVYALMGTCPQINIGPTALLSLLTFTYTNGTNPDFAVLLCFVSGIVQLFAGIVQLGFLVEFVSLPVVSGFTSAAAITIASSQIKGLLGLKFSAESFLGTWKGIFSHIQDTRLQDTLLSLVCCILLLGMKALKDIHIKDPEDEKLKRRAQILRKGLWLTGVARNAVVVILGAILAFFVYQDKNDPLILTGDVTPGLPTPQLPPFQTTVHNTTYSTGAMFSHLGLGLLVVPLVGVISNVAIAKAFARGKTLDATQEIVALGACNIIGAFFRSYPVNGSFTRSAVSDTSGVRTPAAGFYTGIIVILTLALLTPYFYFIPRAALSSVIVCAVLHMVDLDIIKKLWATSKLDLITLLGTFICCLALGIEIGLICGVGIDVILLLYYHSRPPLDVQIVNNRGLPLHYAVRPVGGLHFAGAERVRSKLTRLRNPTNQSLQTNLESLSVIPDTDDFRTNTDNAINNGTISTINNTNYINDDTNSTNKSTDSTNEGTNSTNDGTNSTNDGTNSTRQNATTVLRNEPNGRPQNGVGRNRQIPNVLVVYCDGLYRVDYTFLQSLKMLVAEWSRTGRVLWCEVKPAVKEKLNSVLHDPVYCDSQTLPLFLAGITATEEAHATTDTQL